MTSVTSDEKSPSGRVYRWKSQKTQAQVIALENDITPAWQPGGDLPTAPDRAALDCLTRCEAAWAAGDVAEAETQAAHFQAWACGVTLALPGDTPAGLPSGRWARLPDGMIMARYSRPELAAALAAIAGRQAQHLEVV